MVFYTPKFGLFWAVPQYHRGGRGGGGGGGFVHLAAGTRKSGQWSLAPSYGWGLDYPKSLKLFWEKSAQSPEPWWRASAAEVESEADLAAVRGVSVRALRTLGAGFLGFTLSANLDTVSC